MMEIQGRPGIVAGGDPTNSVGGYPSFRCPAHASDSCVLAERGEIQIVFTAFHPTKGRKSVLVKASSNPDDTNWDLSADRTRVALSSFD